jgi:CRP/FNR family transcriptional regulator
MPYITKLSSFFLFKGLSDEEINNSVNIAKPNKSEFSRGEVIYSPSLYEKKIGFILSGECEVRHNRQASGNIVMNTLGESDSFGVLAAFSDNEFLTEIVATRKTEILFFSKDAVITLIESNGKIALNIISFLAERIEFLNKKIFTVSANGVDQKLASFLISELNEKGDCFDFNRKKTAESISAGRASVYRALDSLVNLGIVKLDSKKIYIIDPTGLERISK